MDMKYMCKIVIFKRDMDTDLKESCVKELTLWPHKMRRDKKYEKD